MKKLVVLVAALSLFAIACTTNTTIESGAEPESAAPQATAAPAANAQDDSGDNAGQDGESEDRGSGVQATDPTPVPEPTDAPVETDTAEPDQADVPAEEPTAAPVEPSPGAAEAVQAVVEADDWCEAAQAVENGTSGLESLNFTDPVAVEQGVKQSLAVITASRRLVPNEIAADLEQSIVAFTGLAAALQEVNWSFLDLDLSIIDNFDGPMELATYNIQAYNFTACGIGTDPGEPPVIGDDGTVEGSADLPDFDGTIRDQAVQGLVAAGFTVEEADCIFQDLDFTDPAALSDPSQLLNVFSDCGISLDRLAQLGG